MEEVLARESRKNPVKDKLVYRIKWFAFQSRLYVIILQVLFNFIIPDHDAKVFSPPGNVVPNVVDQVINVFFSGLRRWDAVYFLHIANYGYTYENTLAFFPLFPLLVRAVANSVLLPLQYCMSYDSVLLVSAVVLNVAFFVMSAVTLFELSQLVLGDDVKAYHAAQFYCVNPASVFFSAAYSESCYALLAFRGMFMLERNHWLSSSVFFALSGAARSNGLVNCGFLVHRTGCLLVTSCVSWWRANVTFSLLLSDVCRVLVCCVFCLLVCLVPFSAYQYYAYSIYCNANASFEDLPGHVRAYGVEMGYRMAYMGKSVWCGGRLPLSYTYIQSAHWNVGLFAYYQLRQVPNFLLALPMTLLCSWMLVHFICTHGRHCLCVGLLSSPAVNVAAVKKSDDFLVKVSNESLPANCFVYIVHAGFLMVVSLLVMHVQVMTRFISSSCPVIYWFVASVCQQVRPAASNRDVNFVGFVDCRPSTTNSLLFCVLFIYWSCSICKFLTMDMNRNNPSVVLCSLLQCLINV